jgi:hypothetical protein
MEDITRHTRGPSHDDAAMLLLRFRAPTPDSDEPGGGSPTGEALVE